MKAFISYSHAGKHHLLSFLKWVSQLQSDKLLNAWFDAQIGAGAEWNERIIQEMEDCEIAFFLVTQDFIHSDYISRVEIRNALEKARIGEMAIVPVLCEVSTFDALSELCVGFNKVPQQEWFAGL